MSSHLIFKNPALPREVLKWLQSLDLSVPIKNVKRAFTSGLVVAEILFWYYPGKVWPCCYPHSKNSVKVEQNWLCLIEVIKKLKLPVPMPLIYATMYEKDGAAELLACKLYTILTNRKLDKLNSSINFKGITFNDKEYQEQLPMFAKRTASMAIRKNVTHLQNLLQTGYDNFTINAEQVLKDHYLHRCEDRVRFPERFDIKPTLGQLAVRKLPKNLINDDDASADVLRAGQKQSKPPAPSSGALCRDQLSKYRFIEVQQMNKRNQMSIRKFASIHTLQQPTSTK